MNSKTTFLITSILAFALLANVNVGSVLATGGLDDEEEEEAIEELQNAVQEIKGTLGTIELNLTEGSNDIQANCPSTEEIVQEVVENITNNNNNNNETEEQPGCPLVAPEPEPAIQPPVQNQTVIPPIQNETQGCNPIVVEEPVENETQSDLVPIICPINGELLGYTNTTSGEQLPISAGENQTQSNNTVPFLPPIELPTEEQNQTTVVPQEPQQCNVTAQPIEEQEQSIVPEQNVTVGNNPVEFDVNCGCYAVDKSTQEVQ
jgi:hypothetical protein